MPTRECLCCGMKVAVSLSSFPDLPLPSAQQAASGQHCPKCDTDLFTQTDGSCLTVDIAHQRESVRDALVKLDEALSRAYAGYYSHLRLIVGSGQIKAEALGQLHFYQNQMSILSYLEEGHNQGSLMIQIRHDR